MDVSQGINDYVLYFVYIGVAVIILVFAVSLARGLRGTPSPKKSRQARPKPARSRAAKPAPALTIFISYRRDDSAGYAGRLYDRLRASFAKDHLFMDIDNIPPGHDFVDVLEKAIEACQVVLVLIGKQWLTITRPDGVRRLDDPHDFVRLEIAAALRRRIRVIPVLVRDATMPSVADLPTELHALARRQALVISDDDFHHDVDRLIAAIKEEAPGSGG